MLGFYGNDDGYVVDEPSDDDDNDLSSEEEAVDFDSFLKSPSQRARKYDFEDEMNEELNRSIALRDVSTGVSSSKPVNKPGKSEKAETSNEPGQSSEPKYYDDIYFDTDESGSDKEESSADSKAKKSKKRRVLTNEELFYDPNMDDDDQLWVDRRRRKYQPHKGRVGCATRPLPNSDAVLNCPACMSLLCLDCQRHDVYSSQYRAMFVENCSINFLEFLKYPAKSHKKRKGPQGSTSDAEVSNGESYHPVSCSVCKTEVAVYDQQEVYHFFNVLASHA